ncbi:hypothetical protein ABZ038_24130 [Streptomyces sp. NPDC006349]|uniref:hypothetical protein n=1 Tax=Streptomyces sp. NPDC006349 TaxID=3156757 RepID=UPI0033AC5AE9
MREGPSRGDQIGSGGPPAVATPRLVADLTAERARTDRKITGLLRPRAALDGAIDAAGG